MNTDSDDDSIDTDRDRDTPAEAVEILESALRRPRDEWAYYARHALDELDAGHPAREPLEAGLAGEVDQEAAVRAAYGELPPGRDDNAVAAVSGVERPTEFPSVHLGSAAVRIDVDEETYQHLHDEYLRAVDQGYTREFGKFAYNYTTTTHYVTVDGECVDLDAPADGDGGEE